MSQLHILLVEDDPDDVELMHQALVDNSVAYTIDSVSQGDRVIPFLDSCKKFPDLIVLDLNVPKLHGREVLKKLKGSREYAAIPVVILTTASSLTERENCINLGADAFISKPSSVKGFAEMVAIILSVAVRVSP